MIATLIASSASVPGSASALAALRSGPTPAGGVDNPPPAVGTPRSAAPQPLLNPSLRYDQNARVVVLEFFDKTGEVSRTIPPERVLEAYARERKQGSTEPTLLATAG